MAAGIVVVWSGHRPRYDAFAIPPDGLRLGRAQLDPGDIEISRHHVELTVLDGRLGVRELGSRNGCLVDGEHLTHGQSREVGFPAVLRIGRTIAIAMHEVVPDRALDRRGAVVVASTLAEPCRALDAAARAEEHVAILGPLALGCELARSYAKTIGGDRIEVMLDPMTALPMESSIDRACSPRTMILVLDRPLTLPDQPELEQWLETDVRIASVARCTDSFKYMPKELRARMMPHVIEIPPVRLDELPATVFDRVQARAPDAKIHASLIENVLLRVPNLGEEHLTRYLEHALDEWRRSGLAVLGGSDLDDYIEAEQRMRNCIVGQLP